jgi:hypothetical protein
MRWYSDLLRSLCCSQRSILVSVRGWRDVVNIQYPRKARFVKVWYSSGQGKISAFAHLESSLFNSSELNVRGRRGLKDFIVDYCADN